jgi:Ca2+/Na+ antiporter
MEINLATLWAIGGSVILIVIIWGLVAWLYRAEFRRAARRRRLLRAVRRGRRRQRLSLTRN